MTEKEKMISGQLYNPSDDELVRDRKRAKRLCFKINNLEPGQKGRSELIKELFQTDNNPWVEPTFWCDYGYNIKVGKNFYMNHNCVILDVNEVSIGDNVMCASGVQILSATHPTDVKERNSGLEIGLPVEIKDNVWIGAGAIILPGAKIGSNTTIGAGSVVVYDIPDNVVAVGNPCKVIKKL